MGPSKAAMDPRDLAPDNIDRSDEVRPPSQLAETQMSLQSTIEVLDKRVNELGYKLQPVLSDHKLRAGSDTIEKAAPAGSSPVSMMMFEQVSRLRSIADVVERLTESLEV